MPVTRVPVWTSTPIRFNERAALSDSLLPKVASTASPASKRRTRADSGSIRVYESPDDSERGLLFLAYQTSIEQQFELLSRKWMNRPNAPEPSSGHDLLVGQERGRRTATLASPGGATVEVSTERVWIVPTGGGYFFSPSVSALKAIASGELGVT